MWSDSPVDSSSSDVEVQDPHAENYFEVAFSSLPGRTTDLLMNRTTDKQKRRFAVVEYLTHVGNYLQLVTELSLQRLGPHARSEHAAAYMLATRVPFNLTWLRSVRSHVLYAEGFMNPSHAGWNPDYSAYLHQFIRAESSNMPSHGRLADGQICIQALHELFGVAEDYAEARAY